MLEGGTEIIQHTDERRTGKSLNEYQFSITSSDESAQRATSDGKLIRVQGFSCPEVMSACCITIPATTELRGHHCLATQLFEIDYFSSIFLVKKQVVVIKNRPQFRLS